MAVRPMRESRLQPAPKEQPSPAISQVLTPHRAGRSGERSEARQRRSFPPTVKGARRAPKLSGAQDRGGGHASRRPPARGAPMSDPEPRRSPLHDEHVALGAVFTDFAGWHMPLKYGS